MSANYRVGTLEDGPGETFEGINIYDRVQVPSTHQIVHEGSHFERHRSTFKLQPR